MCANSTQNIHLIENPKAREKQENFLQILQNTEHKNSGPLSQHKTKNIENEPFIMKCKC